MVIDPAQRLPLCATVLAALFGGSLPSQAQAQAQAQARMASSTGVQSIPIGYELCRQRAIAALQSAGFGVDVTAGAWPGGV